MDEGSLALLVVLILVSVFVYADADKLNMRGGVPSSPLLWALGCFLLLIVFLPMYLMARPGWLKRAERGAAPRPSVPPIDQSLVRMLCPRCGESIPTAANVCRFCNHQVRS